MRKINIHEAKTQLSMLIDRAVRHGESFVIAKAGKPMVKVVPVDQAAVPPMRIGFMKGRIAVPTDFAERDAEAIEALFTGRQ